MSVFDVPAYEALAEAVRPDTVVDIALASFVSRGAAMPFEWGVCDCALWACDWILERRGVDPLAARRRTYDSPAAAAEILTANGGLDGLMSAACAAAEIERGPATVGAIGIVGTLLGPAVMIAASPDRWIGKAPRGIRVIKAEPSLVWSI